MLIGRILTLNQIIISIARLDNLLGKTHAGIPSLKETDPDSMLVFLGNVSARHFVTVDSFLLMKLHSLLTHTISAQPLAGPGGLQRNMTRLEMAIIL